MALIYKSLAVFTPTNAPYRRMHACLAFYETLEL